MFKVLHSGKRRKKQWKRMVTKVTFVGPSFTRKPPKYERFIRPSGAPQRWLSSLHVESHRHDRHVTFMKSLLLATTGCLAVMQTSSRASSSEIMAACQRTIERIAE